MSKDNKTDSPTQKSNGSQDAAVEAVEQLGHEMHGFLQHLQRISQEAEERRTRIFDEELRQLRQTGVSGQAEKTAQNRGQRPSITEQTTLEQTTIGADYERLKAALAGPSADADLARSFSSYRWRVAEGEGPINSWDLSENGNGKGNGNAASQRDAPASAADRPAYTTPATAQEAAA